MRKITAKAFTGTRAWEALPVERFSGQTTVRLHWTDQPYKWHINDGPEVFVVLDGVVDMHTRDEGKESVIRLETGDILHAEAGDEHMAHPQGAARILVVEVAGSV